MRLTTDQTDSTDSADLLSLDWGSLGRLVRKRTLQGVAMHFAAMASRRGQPSQGSAQAEACGSLSELDGSIVGDER